MRKPVLLRLPVDCARAPDAALLSMMHLPSELQSKVAFHVSRSEVWPSQYADSNRQVKEMQICTARLARLRRVDRSWRLAVQAVHKSTDVRSLL